MPQETLTGGQALALGALAGGVELVTSYPGSPSSEVVEFLIEHTPSRDVYIEWSSNEKVALELGIGASIAGQRALVCTKSVGLNVMLDPLMALNLTPVHGGIVILLGDDPGGYGSQNDQDTRPLAVMLEMPMIEPATPSEAFAMMREAFDLSEQLHTVVILRETRSFAQSKGAVNLPARPQRKPDLGLVRELWRFVPVPRNVVDKHRALHERFKAVERWADRAPFNLVRGTGERGILARGFAYAKLLDVLGESPPQELRLLKLGVLYPPPAKLIGEFVAGCREVLSLEENEPFLETQVKAIAHDSGSRARVLGKRSGHVGHAGELFRWQITEALERFVPGFVPARRYRPEDEASERPERENHCAGCRFGAILDALAEASTRLGQRPVLVGDPGCLATVADRLDAKFAIGSAVGVADGLSKAGIAERSVALFGDSSFFHTTLPAICNAVHNCADILMIVLDNGATVTSGFQPHPGVIRDARGEPAPVLNIAAIARACGVEHIREIDHERDVGALIEVFHEALLERRLTLIVVRTPCNTPS